jgi:transcriptional regulator with XRE-family HTH domain
MSNRPEPADIYAGRKLRFQRQLRRFSQSSLADALGVTFQQIQKYENGMNKMSASRLQTIARILGVRVSVFFEDDDWAFGDEAAARKPDNDDEVTIFLSSKEAVQLSRHFPAIKDAGCRQAVLDLVVALAKAGR